MTRSVSNALLWINTFAVTVITLAGCSGEVAGVASERPSSTTTTVIPRFDLTQAGVIDGYRRWLRFAHSTAVDPVQSTADLGVLGERLAVVAGAGVVDAWIETLLERAANGIAVRRESSVQLVDVEAVTVTGAGAVLRGCVRDAGVLYEIGSGRDVDAEIRFERVTVGFAREGRAWKLARVDAVEQVSSCGNMR